MSSGEVAEQRNPTLGELVLSLDMLCTDGRLFNHPCIDKLDGPVQLREWTTCIAKDFTGERTPRTRTSGCVKSTTDWRGAEQSLSLVVDESEFDAKELRSQPGGGRVSGKPPRTVFRLRPVRLLGVPGPEAQGSSHPVRRGWLSGLMTVKASRSSASSGTGGGLALYPMARAMTAAACAAASRRAPSSRWASFAVVSRWRCPAWRSWS